MSLEQIAELSRGYGVDKQYVLEGGGNTSFKDEKHLFVKPSGVRLADLKSEDFVKMDRVMLRKIFDYMPPDDVNEREETVKNMTFDTVVGNIERRPSVEAPLHEAIPYAYVVHLHPAIVNGMTCGKKGREKSEELFENSLWVNYVDPGFMLAKTVHNEVRRIVEDKGRAPNIVFIQNHGVFVGADTIEEIKVIYERIISLLTDFYTKNGVSVELETSSENLELVREKAPLLRSLLGGHKERKVVTTPGFFRVAEGPFSPEHILFAQSYALVTEKLNLDTMKNYWDEYGVEPVVISVPDKAVFCVGENYKAASTVVEFAKDAALIQQLTTAFGGPNFLSKKSRKFIENWELEAYRKKVASVSTKGRLTGKIAVITGGAQGFGLGIAEGLAAEGADICIVDLNLPGAEEAAENICEKFGENSAFALKANIADEKSIESMVEQLVRCCGGLDIFVANAGVLKAGSVKALSKKEWDFVTDINYTGYFLCVKHIASIMSNQNSHGGDWTDIIQINSKSGLVGSNRNGAYAGSKFGAIGLTQSFALELVENKIKVNSICPGNFFEGPLWSDPDKGLFVQYLREGKVPGAKTVEDVKKFYEQKVPMQRGCCPDDVVKAILYVVEQKYETGQAIAVTGGQVMLN